MEYTEKALNLLKDFTGEYLHGNIDELANFSFWDIWGEKEYDNGKNYPDGDCTKIVYAIDYLLYFDTIAAYSTPYYLNKNGDYIFTGDTINTFRTLFGNRFKHNGEKRVETDFQFTQPEIEIKNDFFRTYQKIGNFYLLPCKTILKDKKHLSLNTYRNDEWFDYFDLFLNKLKNRLPLKNSVSNGDIFQMLLNENKNFFNEEINKFLI